MLPLIVHATPRARILVFFHGLVAFVAFYTLSSFISVLKRYSHYCRQYSFISILIRIKQSFLHTFAPGIYRSRSFVRQRQVKSRYATSKEPDTEVFVLQCLPQPPFPLLLPPRLTLPTATAGARLRSSASLPRSCSSFYVYP